MKLRSRMPETSRRLTWVRIGERYPDLAGTPDDFLALDGDVEVGVVKRIPVGPVDAGEWMWSLFLTAPGPTFKTPTNGTCETREEAARELVACWHAFRRWFGLD